jgi:hypothetical protein
VLVEQARHPQSRDHQLLTQVEAVADLAVSHRLAVLVVAVQAAMLQTQLQEPQTLAAAVAEFTAPSQLETVDLVL